MIHMIIMTMAVSIIFLSIVLNRIEIALVLCTKQDGQELMIDY